jgi:hypothetical protein
MASQTAQAETAPPGPADTAPAGDQLADQAAHWTRYSWTPR